jgi:septum formation protein
MPFEQKTPPFDENSVPFTGDPSAYVHALSKGKAHSLLATFPDAVILTADTVVYKSGKVYNKPIDLDDAFQAVSELAGDWHSVFTGVTVLLGSQEFTGAEETRVLFNPLTPEQIRHYHQKMEWRDKAGGYAIQMGGGLVINRIEGCYYNVMGLPVNTARELLFKAGIDLWLYLK